VTADSLDDRYGTGLDEHASGEHAGAPAGDGLMVALPREARRNLRTAESAERPLKRNMPLVPKDTIAGRALVTVVAIMTFLAALTAGVAILIADASAAWQSDVSREMTIQVRPMPGRDIEADTKAAVAIARTANGVMSVDAYSKGDSERLLQPWLGVGLDLSDLPVPRLIVVNLDPSSKLELAPLRAALAAQVPGATVDDHQLWLARLATMANATVAVGIVIFALVLVAMLLAVAFATRGAMAGNKEIIEILHFVGAADSFISRQFQTHFIALGLRGGLIGGAAAILFFLISSEGVRLWRTTAGGEQIEALFGTFSLTIGGYIAIFLIAAAIALLTGFVSRLIVYRHLRRL
jgi:cell division transport system permease protein